MIPEAVHRPGALSQFAFDEARFEALCEALREGALDPERKVLSVAPEPLREGDPDAPGRIDPATREDAQAAQVEAYRARGRDAIRAGQIALVLMAGGMATRFGGGAKAAVSLLDDRPDTFLSVALAAAQRTAAACQGEIPVVIMTSFATRDAVDAHLDAIDWAGLPQAERFRFDQSVSLRVDADGQPLVADPTCAAWPDTLTCTAPGHGDTLGRLAKSGVLAKLRARGVQHVLVANIDNLGATIDPVLVGAHLEAHAGGAAISVEVVERGPGDAGGCVARLDDGRVAIVEGFRLPPATSIANYPHFNTNSLWFSLDAIYQELPLEWFAVKKQITTPSGETRPVVQFERLIGQATEFLPSRFWSVPRGLRFVPVKTREDLASLAGLIRKRLEAPDDYAL